jgi:hypothetical protein
MTENKEKELKGIGGWLILVAISVVLSPIRILVDFVPLYYPLFTEGIWEALITPTSEVYNPLWAPLLIGEIVFNSLMFLASFYLIYLFFSKHYLFVKTFITLIVISLIFIPLDSWFVTLILPQEPVFDLDTTREFARIAIFAIIWIPYMLISKRVKATFVEKMPQPKEL